MASKSKSGANGSSDNKNQLVSVLRKNKLFFAGLFLVILIRSYSDTAFILNGAFNYAFYIFFLPNRLLLNR